MADTKKVKRLEEENQMLRRILHLTLSKWFTENQTNKTVFPGDEVKFYKSDESEEVWYEETHPSQYDLIFRENGDPVEPFEIETICRTIDVPITYMIEDFEEQILEGLKDTADINKLMNTFIKKDISNKVQANIKKILAQPVEDIMKTISKF